MIAPASNTRACRQTLLENSGANGARTCIIVVGRVRTRHLFWRIAVTSVPYLFRLQMAKVQLRSARGVVSFCPRDRDGLVKGVAAPVLDVHEQRLVAVTGVLRGHLEVDPRRLG